MSSKWRRFEVLLPLQFNDGRDVPAEWLADAVLEIVSQFGAASYETQRIAGHWQQGVTVYRDNLVRLVIDVPDTLKNRNWLKAFKQRWKANSISWNCGWSATSSPSNNGISASRITSDYEGFPVKGNLSIFPPPPPAAGG